MHDTDIFMLINRKEKVNSLLVEIDRKKMENEELRVTLEDLDDVRTVEKYGREQHLFKKDDEDIFIFSFE